MGHLSKLIDHIFRTAVLPWLCVFSILVSAEKAFSQTGYPLTALSGADGVFEVVVVEGDTVYRSVGSGGSYQPYMYFKADVEIRHTTAYVEVTYKDIGWGLLGIHYNSTTSNYQDATFRRQNYVQNTHGKRTALFVLEDADFRNAQNLGADLRLYTDVSLQMHIVSALVYLEPSPLYILFDEDWISPYEGPEYIGDDLVDASTLSGKVLCGYQGWFRAAGDPSGLGWVHYVHGDFNDLTVEMWPAMLEYTEDEKYAVPHWTHANGDQAYLFSSANKKTVVRHFQWMETYGIDGVAVSRFVVGLSLSHQRESFRIAGYAREAANRTGRTYFIFYDMSGYDTGQLVGTMSDDWHYLVDEMRITDDDRYLHHNGKPVVGIFGFYADRFSAATANNVLDIFQSGGPYGAFVIGSGQWWWRSETAAGWPQVFRRMDGWVPWNVGNYSGDYASTGYWLDDKNEMASAGVLYLPVVYPGFGWDNLTNQPPGTTTKPRLQGDFLWQQFLDANDIGAEAVFVAMFDEIDEATAIFKVTNDIPINHYFLTLEGLPSDFYLLLTGFGTNIIKGQVAVPISMPDFSLQSQPPIPDIVSPAYADIVNIGNEVTISWTPVEHESGVSGYELELDNEIIYLTTTDYDVALNAGEHMARVRAINGLNNTGGFSEAVVFTGVPCQMTLTSPNGGETWCAGETENITWASESTSGDVKIEYSTNGGSNWQTIIENTPDDGSSSWTVPHTPSVDCLMRISCAENTDCFDECDGTFKISDCGPLEILTKSCPDGMKGCTYDITISVSGGVLPHVCSIISGMPPPGLELNSDTGDISGNPESSGDFCFTVQVKDHEGVTNSREYCLTVEEYDGIKGDPNCDYSVDILDVLMTVNIALQLVTVSPEQSWAADCNGPVGNCDGDGEIDIIDALKIVNVLLGLDGCPE